MVLLMLRVFYFPSFSFMKISLKRSIPLLLVVALAGCAGTSATIQEKDNTEPAAAAVSSQATDNSFSSNDHHAGETNVAPHGHDEDSALQKMMDDHHPGETNVPPHGHSVSSHDDSNEPPHRH